MSEKNIQPTAEGPYGAEIVNTGEEHAAQDLVGLAVAGLKEATRTKEIVHFHNADAILNLDAEDSASARSLAEVLSDGIPESWSSLLRDEKVIAYIGEHEGKKYISKIKYSTDSDAIKEVQEDLARDKDEYGDQYAREVARARYRATSVTGELSLAPRVKRIVAQDQIQELVKPLGFKTITYVEPVLAIIDKQTGQKSIIYPFIEGTETLLESTGNAEGATEPLDSTDKLNWWPEEKEQDKLRDRYADLSEAFKDVFYANGIEPNDLGAHQILVKGDELYLVDAELFVPLESSNPTQEK